MAKIELKALYYKTELLLSNPCVYLSHLIQVDKQEENAIQTQPQPPPFYRNTTFLYCTNREAARDTCSTIYASSSGASTISISSRSPITKRPTPFIEQNSSTHNQCESSS